MIQTRKEEKSQGLKGEINGECINAFGKIQFLFIRLTSQSLATVC